jgi:hypothetical protein
MLITRSLNDGSFLVDIAASVRFFNAFCLYNLIAHFVLISSIKLRNIKKYVIKQENIFNVFCVVILI